MYRCKWYKLIAIFSLYLAFAASGVVMGQDRDTEENRQENPALISKATVHSNGENLSAKTKDMVDRNLSTVEPLNLASTPPVRVGEVSVSNGQPTRINDRGVLFERGKVDPKNTENRVNDAELSADGRRHMLMQFDTMPDAERRATLANDGIQILAYVPNQTYWVAVDEAARATAAVDSVHWAWVPDPIYKTSARVDAGDFPPNAVHIDGTVSLQVLLFEDVDSLIARENIDAFGGGVRVVRTLDRQRLEVRSPKFRINEIANLDAVRWIEPAAPPRIEHNATAASRVKADVLYDAPYVVDGHPVTVGIWDGGAVDAHPDFGSRLTVYDLVGIGSHGTHVAGTIGGSGAGNSAAKGMAPLVQLQSYDWNSDTAEMRTAATSRSVVISNHSYGFITGWHWNGMMWVEYPDTGFGLYDSYSQGYDDVVLDTGLLVFKSAGNDRNDGPDCPSVCDGPYDSIGHVGNAKNILTICALTDSDAMTSFSSWGPSNDGRIKPDLCANGYQLTSTLPGGSYGPSSGTSMSSPSAAGTAALLFEHFQNQFATDPSPATLKTLMIHGANDLGRSGPDYEFGWGIIDAEITADLISGGSFTEGSITGAGDQKEYTFEVSTASPIKLTLGWTDPAGEPAAARALVNNLDLLLIDPNGVPHYPWTLDPLNPSTPATTGINIVDNIEQAVVNIPETGTWTARVSGFSVPLGPQSFTLVASSLAVAVPSAPSTPSASDGTYPGKVQVTWSSVSGATSYKVFVCTDVTTGSCGSGYTASAPPYDDTSASPGVTYYYRVQACNVAGCSDYSNYDSGYAASAQAGTLQFASTNYSVNENGGSVSVSVTRSGGSDGVASVSYSTVDGSAVAGSDYTTKSGTLIWTDGDNAAKSFAVSIKNNGAVESNETFTIDLGSAVGASLGSPTSTSVTILDDDGLRPGVLQFSSSAYSVDEFDGTVTVLVTRTDGSDGVASVSYSTVDGSAIAGSDYTADSATLTWTDGDSTTKSFTVSINNDATVEENETFTVSLTEAVGASLGSPTSTSVTILDDDVAQPGTLQFSSSTYSVNEYDGSVTVSVTRNGGSDGGASVSYSTIDGSAIAGSDYISKSATLTWADGDNSAKSFAVSITNDAILESSEAFTIVLSGATGANLGSPASTSVTILDDEPAAVSCSGSKVYIEGHIFQPGIHECVATTSITLIDTGIAPSADVRITSPTTLLGSDFRVLEEGKLRIDAQPMEVVEDSKK